MGKNDKYTEEERRNIKAFIDKLDTAYFVDNRSIASPMEFPEFKKLPLDIKTEFHEWANSTNRFFDGVWQSQKKRHYIPLDVCEKIQHIVKSIE